MRLFFSVLTSSSSTKVTFHQEPLFILRLETIAVIYTSVLLCRSLVKLVVSDQQVKLCDFFASSVGNIGYAFDIVGNVGKTGKVYRSAKYYYYGW